jgi:hypothetical protein
MPERPEVALGVDVIAPEGYGEIIGGGQRIHDLDLLLKRWKNTSCRGKPSTGISICASTARCRTAASAWAWSAWLRGCAAWSMFARRSPIPPLDGPMPSAAFLENLPPHSVENVGDQDIHLVSVEMKD